MGQSSSPSEGARTSEKADAPPGGAGHLASLMDFSPEALRTDPVAVGQRAGRSASVWATLADVLAVVAVHVPELPAGSVSLIPTRLVTL